MQTSVQPRPGPRAGQTQTGLDGARAKLIFGSCCPWQHQASAPPPSHPVPLRKWGQCSGHHTSRQILVTASQLPTTAGSLGARSTAQAGRASRWGLLLSQHSCQSGDLYLHTVHVLPSCGATTPASGLCLGRGCSHPSRRSLQPARRREVSETRASQQAASIQKGSVSTLRRRGRLGEQRSRPLCSAQAGSVRRLLLDLLCGDRQLWTRSLAR